jgi:hypothetical protein
MKDLNMKTWNKTEGKEFGIKVVSSWKHNFLRIYFYLTIILFFIFIVGGFILFKELGDVIVDIYGKNNQTINQVISKWSGIQVQ